MQHVKIGFMKTALRAKFAQHADLLAILLGTGSAKIVERNDGDAYWYVVRFIALSCMEGGRIYVSYTSA